MRFSAYKTPDFTFIHTKHRNRYYVYFFAMHLSIFRDIIIFLGTFTQIYAHYGNVNCFHAMTSKNRHSTYKYHNFA